MRDYGRVLRGPSGRVAPAALLAVMVGLPGCVQDLPGAKTESRDIRGAIARGEVRSPRAAPIALASIDGAPEAVTAHFKEAVTTEAASREITFTDASLARYLVRGYLDAYPTDQGTAVRYVWDVYDASKQRTQRLDNGVDLPGNVPNPWSALDETVLAGLASRSADEIAAYLATTPEAGGPPATVGSLAPPVEPN